jgi:hypothetical protein
MPIWQARITPMSNWHPKPKPRHRYPDEPMQCKRRIKQTPAEAIPARIIIVSTGKVHSTYPSHSQANKVLAKLIVGLPSGAPPAYLVEDDI